jgi:hypothetical protein
LLNKAILIASGQRRVVMPSEPFIVERISQN